MVAVGVPGVTPYLSAAHPDVVQGDATRLPIRDDRFDLAVCVHVFHLVGDWRGAIAERGRVVRATGAVLIAGDDVPEYAGIIRRF